MISDILAPGPALSVFAVSTREVLRPFGFHFAHPGNRFWKVIHQAGFTDRQLRPEEELQLLDTRCGITMLIGRASDGAGQRGRLCRSCAAAAVSWCGKLRSISCRPGGARQAGLRAGL